MGFLSRKSQNHYVNFRVNIIFLVFAWNLIFTQSLENMPLESTIEDTNDTPSTREMEVPTPSESPYNDEKSTDDSDNVSTVISKKKESLEVADESMCAWMFDILINHLSGHKYHPRAPESVSKIEKENAKYPMFVTWKKQKKGAKGFSNDELDLRGCIGSLTPLSITSLEEYALNSSIHDHRFSPVTSTEVPHLQCQVSLLHSYELCDNMFDWDINKHGIVVRFNVGSRSYSATYLPEVAKENGMDHTETIKSLIAKAGYHGPTKEVMKHIQVTRYQSSITSLNYQEYAEKYKDISQRE